MSTTPSKLGRRDALKVGGLAVSLAAIAAACGNDRGGDDDAGRVGSAPPITDPPSYSVDDSVLLRTASSLEYTVINAYLQMRALGGIDADIDELLGTFLANHQAVADEMGELTVAAGGEAWTCTNQWYMDRSISPMMASIASSDNPQRDMFNLSVALENLAASTHQAFSIRLTEPDAQTASLTAAKLESRQSALMVTTGRGPDGYVSPGIDGADVPPDADGIPQAFAITAQFGSIGQAELVLGAADENGVRTTYVVQIPAENSYIYNELEPTC